MNWIPILAVLAFTCAAADLDSIKAEPDADKRSEHALDHAEAALSKARDDYSSGEYKRALQGVRNVAQVERIGQVVEFRAHIVLAQNRVNVTALPDSLTRKQWPARSPVGPVVASAVPTPAARNSRSGLTRRP